MKKEEQKDKPSLEEISPDEGGSISGGIVGLEKYSLAEYSRAGVVWEHNLFGRDRYFIQGKEISRQVAETIVENAFSFGRMLTNDELKVLGIDV